MPDRLCIVAVTDDRGVIVDPGALARAEGVHRQLRTQLEPDYGAHMQRVFHEGARMCVAERRGVAVGVAVYRVYENTNDGRHLYVDDLVTSENARSTGVGKALLEHLQQIARAQGCGVLTLDSGTQRQRAHGFYLREGLFIRGFHFGKRVE